MLETVFGKFEGDAQDLHSARLSKRTSRTAEQRMYLTKPIVAQYHRLSEPSQRARQNISMAFYKDTRIGPRTCTMIWIPNKNERQSKSGRAANLDVVCRQCTVIRIALFLEGYAQRRI